MADIGFIAKKSLDAKKYLVLFFSFQENFTCNNLGSGTFIKYNNKYFILTAAHVLEELCRVDKGESFIKCDIHKNGLLENDSVYNNCSFCVKRVIWSIRSCFEKCDLQNQELKPKSEYLLDQEWDFGVIPLEQSYVNYLLNLGNEFLEVKKEELLSGYCFAFGVPNVQGHTAFVYPLPFNIKTSEIQSIHLIDSSPNEVIHLDRGTKIFVIADMKTIRKKFTTLGGLSGGGIFLISNEEPYYTTLIGTVLEEPYDLTAMNILRACLISPNTLSRII
jgi:hypothetical protein